MITIAINENNDIFTNSNGKLSYIYNPDAFTVVGSPIVTDDGIASNFSASNNITSSVSVTPTQSIILRAKGVWSSIPNTADSANVLSNIVAVNHNPAIDILGDHASLVRWISNSSNVKDLQIYFPNMTDGDVVEATAIATSTNLTLTVKINNTSYSKTVAGNGLHCGQISEWRATFSGNWYWTGSIDLKYSELIVDEVKIFSGKKIVADSNLVLSKDINALANISKNKVLTTYGEPEYNQQTGIPYFDTIFADTPKIDLFQASIIDNLESLENVERVSDFQYTQNNGTFSYSLVENTTFGQIQLNG